MARPVQVKNEWLVLGFLSLGVFIILVCTTIVNIATPAMISGLNSSLDQILWVVNAYLLVCGVRRIRAIPGRALDAALALQQSELQHRDLGQLRRGLRHARVLHPGDDLLSVGPGVLRAESGADVPADVTGLDGRGPHRWPHVRSVWWQLPRAGRADLLCRRDGARGVGDFPERDPGDLLGTGGARRVGIGHDLRAPD